MYILSKLQKKHTRTVIGLMSGTSHDGVDAAVARITGSGAGSRAALVGLTSMPYPPALRARVAAAFDGTAADICRLDFELGEFFAKAALAAMKGAGLSPVDIDLIGSHGQTVYHIPPAGKRPGSTLQIGEAAIIARRTGVVTVSDFRPADIAAGGQGAPLVPYADWVLFRKPGAVTAVQNIGGIANVTVVTERLEDVTGFDTGPGCSLIDEAVKILTGGKKSYDSGGNMAACGDIIQDMLAKLLSNPYFRKKPPKSTGRETFGRAMAERSIKEYADGYPADILCTLTELTVHTIYEAYRMFVFPKRRPDRIVLAGGGAKNGFLVELLKLRFGGTPVMLSDELGVPVMAREALCFAVLANETISGVPSNVPAVTGASAPAVLGKISLP